MSKKSPDNPASGVCLQFDLPEAVTGNVAGSFNDWNPASLPMVRKAEGRWERDLPLPAGRYEFRPVVDGARSGAPGGPETVENPPGARNAVLHVLPPGAKPPGQTASPGAPAPSLEARPDRVRISKGQAESTREVT